MEWNDLVNWCKLNYPEYTYLPETELVINVQSKLIAKKDIPVEELTINEKHSLFVILPIINDYLV